MAILGELQSDFCKNPTEFYQISLKNLPDLTDFSPQLMACMQIIKVNICVQGRISSSTNGGKLIFHMRMYLYETSRNIQEL